MRIPLTDHRIRVLRHNATYVNVALVQDAFQCVSSRFESLLHPSIVRLGKFFPFNMQFLLHSCFAARKRAYLNVVLNVLHCGELTNDVLLMNFSPIPTGCAANPALHTTVYHKYTYTFMDKFNIQIVPFGGRKWL